MANAVPEVKQPEQLTVAAAPTAAAGTALSTAALPDVKQPDQFFTRLLLLAAAGTPVSTAALPDVKQPDQLTAAATTAAAGTPVSTAALPDVKQPERFAIQLLQHLLQPVRVPLWPVALCLRVKQR